MAKQPKTTFKPGDRVESPTGYGPPVPGTVVKVVPPRAGAGDVLVKFDNGHELWDDSRDLVKM